MLWADDVFRIAVLACWPRYTVLNVYEEARIVELYRCCERCDEPEKMTAEDVAERVNFFVESTRDESKAARKKRAAANEKTVQAVLEMHRQLVEAAEAGHAVLRPDSYGGFGFFRPALQGCKDVDSGLQVAAIRGCLGQRAKVSKAVADGVYGGKSSIVTRHQANDGGYCAPLCGMLSYFNGSCVHCAQARFMNADGTGDGWEAAQWTRQRTQPGEQIYTCYGSAYHADSGCGPMHESPYLPTVVPVPFATPEDHASAASCPQCRVYASSSDDATRLRASWTNYVAGELLQWHQWLCCKSPLTDAIVAASSTLAKDVSALSARKAASKHGVTLSDFESAAAAPSIPVRIRDMARNARAFRDFAKQLIYGPKRLNLAAVSELEGSRGCYHTTRLTDAELGALTAAAHAARASQAAQVLLVRRLNPHFTLSPSEARA